MHLEGGDKSHLVRHPGDSIHPPEVVHHPAGPSQPAQGEFGFVELVVDLVPVVLPEMSQGRGSLFELLDAFGLALHMLAGERREPFLAGESAVRRPRDLATPPEVGRQLGIGGIERGQELVIAVVGLAVGFFVPGSNLVGVAGTPIEVIDPRGCQHGGIGRQMHPLREERVDEAGRVAAQERAPHRHRRCVVGPVADHPHLVAAFGPIQDVPRKPTPGEAFAVERLDADLAHARAAGLVADDAHAVDVVLERDDPDPPLLAGDREDVPFQIAAEPLAAPEVGPHGQVLEVAVESAQAQLPGYDSPRSGSIDHEVALQGTGRSVVAPGYRDRAAVRTHPDVGYLVFLSDIGAALAGGVQQNLIVFGSSHLIRVVVDPGRGPGGGEGKGPRRLLGTPDKGRGTLPDEIRRLDPVHHAESVQNRHGAGQKRFAEPVAGELLPLEHDHVAPQLPEAERRHAAGRPAAHHDHRVARLRLHRRVFLKR